MKSFSNIDRVQDAYKNHNLPKYITIEFMDADIKPITNKDLTEESLKLIESICEENTFEFGGCNASQLSFTVFGRMEDFKGKKIKCTISLKNPQYRGNFNFVSDYKRRDIVKYSNEYYQFYSDYETPKETIGNINETGGVTSVATTDENGALSFPGMNISVDNDGILSGVSNAATTPDELEDYCDKLYGYYDTGDIDDIVLFRGKIDSVKKQADRNLRDVVAYDWMYDVGQKNITSWFNAKSTGIVETDYVGEWNKEKSVGRGYRKGNIVLYKFYQTTEYKYYYRMKKEFSTTDSEGIRGREPNINPDYWEQLSGIETMTTTSIKDIRNKLSSYLGIKQEFVGRNRLEFDNLELVLFKSDEIITPQMLYENICRLNCCFGKVNPENNAIQYIFIDGGKSAEDVSEIYDPNKCTYQDEKGGSAKNIVIVDSNSNILEGYKDGEVFPYNTESFLLKGYFGNKLNEDYESFYWYLWGAGGTTYIPYILEGAEYVPASLELEGLPYLDAGDNITFDTTDVDKDVNIRTIIMQRTLSGINALTDLMEAKKE